MLASNPWPSRTRSWAYCSKPSLQRLAPSLGRSAVLTELSDECRILMVALQGKYINDKEVLREVARAAKLNDPDRVVDDPDCCAEEV